jgi:hypothetical protein
MPARGAIRVPYETPQLEAGVRLCSPDGANRGCPTLRDRRRRSRSAQRPAEGGAGAPPSRLRRLGGFDGGRAERKADAKMLISHTKTVLGLLREA